MQNYHPAITKLKQCVNENEKRLQDVLLKQAVIFGLDNTANC